MLTLSTFNGIKNNNILADDKAGEIKKVEKEESGNKIKEEQKKEVKGEDEKQKKKEYITFGDLKIERPLTDEIISEVIKEYRKQNNLRYLQKLLSTCIKQPMEIFVLSLDNYKMHV